MDALLHSRKRYARYSKGYRKNRHLFNKIHIRPLVITSYSIHYTKLYDVEHFGNILGLEKIDWRQRAIDIGLIDSNSDKGSEFMQWHEDMDVYCERDVEVNILIFEYLKKEWKDRNNFV